MFKRGDMVTYFGTVYEVIYAPNGSDVIGIQSHGGKCSVLYTWAWKCRKVECDG